MVAMSVADCIREKRKVKSKRENASAAFPDVCLCVWMCVCVCVCVFVGRCEKEREDTRAKRSPETSLLCVLPASPTVRARPSLAARLPRRHVPPPNAKPALLAPEAP